MICPECRIEGLRSTVNSGMSMTTGMGYTSFWDEDGVHHVHDPNTTTTSYLCSNGHEWGESKIRPCQAPDCDYGKEST